VQRADIALKMRRMRRASSKRGVRERDAQIWREASGGSARMRAMMLRRAPFYHAVTPCLLMSAADVVDIAIRLLLAA